MLNPRGCTSGSRALDEAEAPTSPGPWLLTKRAKQFACWGFAAPDAEGASAASKPRLATSTAALARLGVDLLLWRVREPSYIRTPPTASGSSETGGAWPHDRPVTQCGRGSKTRAQRVARMAQKGTVSAHEQALQGPLGPACPPAGRRSRRDRAGSSRRRGQDRLRLRPNPDVGRRSGEGSAGHRRRER